MNRAFLLTLVVTAVQLAAARAQTPSTAGAVPPGTAAPGSTATPVETNAPAALDGLSLTDEPATRVDFGPSLGNSFRPFEKPLVLQPSIQVRGRVEAEAVMAAQSAESKAILGDLQNGYGFRRVRLGAQGEITDSTSWVSEVELAGGTVRLRDVFVGFDAIPGFSQIRIGHFREPYSLEGMTSSNFMTFLERSPINVLSPARNWGVCGYWWPETERLLFSLGAFRDGTPSNGQSTGDDDSWAYTTRLTGLPYYDPDEDNFRLIHLGGAVSYRIPPDGVINFTPRLTSNLLTVEDNPGSPFLPALDVAANDYQLYNLQAAGVLGAFSVQAEWSSAAVQQPDGNSIFVNGVYVYYSYFLTGEHRSYNTTRGSFDRINVLRPVMRKRGDPRGGFGALEQATRFSYLDFSSPNLPPNMSGIPTSTNLYELSVALNWYLNTNTRFMFDYTAGMPDWLAFGSTVAHTFGTRAALYW
ncbi:MAG: hypothetical protein K1X74_07535 [Pirellulales bacterium]|nr:hypothetical protein [Pirellulales bacterium]